MPLGRYRHRPSGFLQVTTKGFSVNNEGKRISTREAVRKTVIFSTILVVGGLFGCIAGSATGDTPPIVFGGVAIVCGIVLGILSLLAHRKSRS